MEWMKDASSEERKSRMASCASMMELWSRTEKDFPRTDWASFEKEVCEPPLDSTLRRISYLESPHAELIQETISLSAAKGRWMREHRARGCVRLEMWYILALPSK